MKIAIFAGSTLLDVSARSEYHAGQGMQGKKVARLPPHAWPKGEHGFEFAPPGITSAPGMNLYPSRETPQQKPNFALVSVVRECGQVATRSSNGEVVMESSITIVITCAAGR